LGKPQFFVEKFPEEERDQLRTLILSNEVDFKENGDEFEAVVRIKHIPKKPTEEEQQNRAMMRQS
jgi:hypothetical protein